MKYILLLFFTVFSFTTNAQYHKLGIDVMGDKEIDSGNIRIYYNFSQIDSTKKNDDGTYKRQDIQRLEIGNQFSKYYSYAAYHNDSLTKIWRRKNPSAQAVLIWMTSIIPNQVWSEYIRSVYIKNFSTNQLTDYAQTALYAPNYQYTEEIPIQDWEISNDTLTIAGYLCQKATCRFRGRDFTAWFAPEIPIGNGPWKFGGLPGLILKVYDSDNLYVFECNKIENHNEAYPLKLREIKYEETVRDKYIRYIRDVHDDYGKLIQLTRMDGTPAKKNTFALSPVRTGIKSTNYKLLKQIIMKYILLLFFTVFSFTTNAQGHKFGIDVMGDNEIDSGTVRIYYNFSQIDSTWKNDDDTFVRRDIHRLEIGDRYSKYYSYILFNNDSLVKVWRKKILLLKRLKDGSPLFYLIKNGQNI